MILSNVLTIIIPVYNEKKTINQENKVIRIKNLKKQIIIVDDGSTDGTTEILKTISNQNIYKIIYSKNNMGKGHAIKLAQSHVHGEFVIIQDADLEYNPNDIKKIIKVFRNKDNKVVYGSRVLNSNRYRKNYLVLITRPNKKLSQISNIINNQNLTDAHTCYKAL